MKVETWMPGQPTVQSAAFAARTLVLASYDAWHHIERTSPHVGVFSW